MWLIRKLRVVINYTEKMRAIEFNVRTVHEIKLSLLNFMPGSECKKYETVKLTLKEIATGLGTHFEFYSRIFL